jgi:hypothetical protein
MTQAAPKRLNATNIEAVLSGLASHSGALQLDLRELETMERSAASMLGNALLGTLGSRPIELRVSDDKADWMTASGLAFALANRTGMTQVNGRPAAWLQDSDWARDWLPGNEAPLEALYQESAPELFDPELVGETALRPDLFGPGFAAFVNPHLTRPSIQRHPVTTVIWPWLDRLVPQEQITLTARDRRGNWIADVGRFVDETVSNVCEHARGETRSRLFSMVQVFATRGGSRSSNRLHLSVQDTGVGIAKTARRKLAPRLAASITDDQLLGKLLEGTLAPWGRGRGQGLPRVVEICRRHNGTLRVATKTTRATLGLGQGDTAIRTGAAPFRIDGTVVTLSLPVPSH